VSVQRSQSSIKRGQTAGYVVQVSAKNGTASDVSVALTAQPSSQKPTFSGGCAKNGTASCRLSSVTTKATSLNAKIAVASNATSVSSLKLTATASVVTTTKWTPPAAAETTTVTAAAAKSSGSASPSAAAHMAVLPLGPIPALNGEASVFIGAGNAANLFPTIAPSPGASPRPTAAAAQPTNRNTAPVSEASPVSLGTPVLTAQVAGLIALGVAIMLTVTRLSVRRRSKPRN
jgi:hypothetical protein